MGQQNTGLTDEQIQELAADPQFTEEDRALLTPSERTRLAAAKVRGGGAVGAVKGLAKGFVKGAGETAFELGDMVHNTPGVGNLTDMLAKLVGPEGTNPDGAFSKTPEQLEAHGTAEEIGKTGEQVGEFFIAPGQARKAAIERLVRFIPNATPANQMKILNKIAAITGRVVGEAGSATAVSAIHGDENPQYAGVAGGAGPLVGEGLSSAVGTLKTPGMQKIAPVLAAMLTMKGLGGITPEGLAGGMATFGLAKQGAKRLIENPATVRTAQNVARTGANVGGRVTAGDIDQFRAKKRRLNPEEAYGRDY